MKHINQNRSEGLDGDKLEKLLADVRGHMFKVELSWLAEKAGLSYSTIANLAYGDTKSPHLRTIIKVMTALGKEHPILKAFQSDVPVSLEQAKTRRATSGREKLRQKREDKKFPHRKHSRRRQESAPVVH